MRVPLCRGVKTLSKESNTGRSVAQGRGRLRVTGSFDQDLQKKYRIQHHIRLCDTILKSKFDRAHKVCDKKRPMDIQPECRQVWRELEGLAMVKAELMRQLIELEDIHYGEEFW